MYLQIELTHKCNAKCSFCFRDEVKINKDMDLKTCFNILDMAKEIGVEYIRYVGYGENLLYRDFTKVLKYTTSMFSKVDFNTNATLFNKEISEEIVKSGIDNIVFSVTGFDNAVYKNFQGKDVKYKIEDVNRNILEFIEINNKLKGNVKTYMQYIKTEENIQDLKKYIEFWKNRVTDINISYLSSMYGKIKKYDVQKLKKCGYLGEMFLIHADGDISTCCTDYKKGTKIGNIKEISLNDASKSEELKRMLNYNETLDISFLPEICKKCDAILDDENICLEYKYSELEKYKDIILKIKDKKIILWGLNRYSKILVDVINIYSDNKYILVDGKKEGFYGKNEILKPNLKLLKEGIVITFMERGYKEAKNYLDTNSIQHLRIQDLLENK